MIQNLIKCFETEFISFKVVSSMLENSALSTSKLEKYKIHFQFYNSVSVQLYHVNNQPQQL